MLLNASRVLVSGDLDGTNALNEAFAAKFTNPHVQNVPDAQSYPVENM